MRRMSARILIIEDEKDITRLLKFNLEKEGYTTLAAHDGEAGFRLARAEKPDLIILDLMLPKLDGREVCREIRKESQVPILMLTAKKEELDRILGLELGADDYMTKPFSVRELVARVKAILRRTRPPAQGDDAVKAGQMEVDFNRYTVTVRGKPVAVSSKEFQFLKILIQANGKAMTRDMLLEQVWGHDPAFEIDTRTIDQHIARLREKLGAEAMRIITVKNVGYRFDNG
jgi:DNA-binding response OmpR family regulator